MLSEGSCVKGNPEDQQASAPCIMGSAKISGWVALALYTGLCCDRTCGADVLFLPSTFKIVCVL